MKVKYRMGTIEICAAIAGTIISAVIYTAMGGAAANSSGFMSYFFPEVWLEALIAILFGPVAGVFSSLCGIAVSQLIADGAISLPGIIANVIFALFISLFADRFRVREGKFTWREAIDFNVIQITANILAAAMVMPMAAMLINKASFTESVTLGCRALVGNVIGIAVVGTGILFATAAVIDRVKPKEATPNPWLRKVV